MPAGMLWRVSSRPVRSRSKPPGFILPCQPALADRPPSGPGWLHEMKFDGYRVIARKDGEQVRLWARTTSDYSKAFTRIRDAVAALPVDSAVLDGEAIVMRSAHRCDFEALRSRQGQAEAILVAYDIMEVDGRDVRRISKGFLFEMLFASPFLHARHLDHLDQRLPVLGPPSRPTPPFPRPPLPTFMSEFHIKRLLYRNDPAKVSSTPILRS